MNASEHPFRFMTFQIQEGDIFSNAETKSVSTIAHPLSFAPAQFTASLALDIAWLMRFGPAENCIGERVRDSDFLSRSARVDDNSFISACKREILRRSFVLNEPSLPDFGEKTRIECLCDIDGTPLVTTSLKTSLR